jgi:DNA invertase Pin-like site-specific DNA recombinase
MPVFAYVRVSTETQDTENQRYEILKFADEKKVTIAEWCVETVSGTKSYRDRKLGELLNRLAKDDTLILTEISRLGRSLMEVMEILHHCMQTGAHVLTCKERFELGDNINSKILAFAFGLAAEIERQMISQRTKEALARLKSEGRSLGRKRGTLGKSKLDGQEDNITDLLKKGVSKGSICKIYACHPGTLDSFIITRKLQTKRTTAP